MYKLWEVRTTDTAPSLFPVYINLYQNLLRKKHGELIGNMERLEGGLEKLKSTAAQVNRSVCGVCYSSPNGRNLLCIHCWSVNYQHTTSYKAWLRYFRLLSCFKKQF